MARMRAALASCAFPLIQKVPGMLALFSNRRRVLVAFATLTGVLLVSLLVLFNIV
jgi:hypothetical protein